MIFDDKYREIYFQPKMANAYIEMKENKRFSVNCIKIQARELILSKI